MSNHPRFSEIMFADLRVDGSVQGGLRPVLIVQNDVGNQYSSTVEVIPLTSRTNKAKHMPTHVPVRPDARNGLRKESVVLAENVVTIPKTRLREHIGFASRSLMAQVGQARYIQSPLPIGAWGQPRLRDRLVSSLAR